MKKISLITLGIVAGLSVSAQPDVVKNAEGLMKSKKFAEALETIQPALSNPATAETAAPWYIAGKSALGLWEPVNLALMTQQDVPADQLMAGSKALVDAYNYFVKALPYDQLPDEKGKVKPKYTKEIRKILGENYKGYLSAGLNFYNASNYPAAYEAWDLYVELPKDANADPKAYIADPDTIVGQIAYYQALAAYFEKQYANSLKKVQQALDMGYDEKNLYIVGMEAADNVQDAAASQKFAALGNRKYGSEDISFLANVINANLQTDNYPACYEAIDESFAIAANDSIKSSLYNVRAIINERENKIDDAKANLEQSLKLNPNNAKSYFDMGRLLQNGVAAQEEAADEATRLNVLVPELKKALEYFEKSYELDDTQSSLPGIIYRLYYQLDQNYHLGDEYAQKASYWEALK